MPKIKNISIENFRSIGDTPVDIHFPKNQPVILIGENNSGKSNIIRAIDLMFGEFHPKYKKLDDFDHFNRNPNNRIVIKGEVAEFKRKLGKGGEFDCGGFEFSCKKYADNEFLAVQMQDGKTNPFVSTALREELLCVVVNSEQNLNYQLSYSTKYTLLSKVTKSFHDKLVENPDRVEELKMHFGAIKDVFKSVQEFAGFTEQMSSIAGKMLSNMSHALQFDFSAYDPSNYFKTLRVHPNEDGETRAFEELGTGQQQILALSFAHAYARSFLGQGLIFILDEPESHLHPLAQRWLARQMYQMANDGLQLVITTHSPYFINLDFLDSIYLVRKEDQTFVTNVTANTLAEFCKKTGAPKASKDTIVSFYSAHSVPQILNGFFSNKILLVEGLTEELSLPIYLQAVGLDCLEEGIAVIGVGGKGNLAKWWRFFSVYKIPTYICFDNDKKDDDSATKRKDALQALGIKADTVHSIIAEEAWNIAANFCVFGKDFELTMRQSFKQYNEHEEASKTTYGDSKPIIAKTVAALLVKSKDDTEAGWKRFSDFKDVFIKL